MTEISTEEWSIVPVRGKLQGRWISVKSVVVEAGDGQDARWWLANISRRWLARIIIEAHEILFRIDICAQP